MPKKVEALNALVWFDSVSWVHFCWPSPTRTESPNSSDMKGTWHREELNSEPGTKSPELTTSL